MPDEKYDWLKAKVRSREGWSSAVETARRLTETVRPRSPHDAPKFLNLDYWLNINVHRAVKLGLDHANGLNVLDLGSGTGQLLFVCETLGHTATGIDLPSNQLDWPEREIFAEMPAAFGVHVTQTPIRAFEPLRLRRNFDLIVAFMVCFNNHKLPDEWGRPEWEYFVDDMRSLLRPNGRLALRLNHNEERFGFRGYLDGDARRFFEGVGSFDDGKILIDGSQVLASRATS